MTTAPAAPRPYDVPILVALELTPDEWDVRAGARGEGARWAMALVERYAAAVGARRLVPIVSAHVDGCLHHGPVSLDFVDRLLMGDARVAVPTTLNVGSIDLIHPGLVAGDRGEADPRRRLMRAHLALGCEPSFTCAPYAAARRPRLGDQIAWGESNAIAFANSVLGARTERYGDFIDLACAVVGRAPAHGLHLEENRRSEVVVELAPDCAALELDALCVGLGYVLGARCGARVPVVVGLPEAGEDRLKALGATAASSGGVALFHVVGQTPEAPDLRTALGDRAPGEVVRLGVAELRAALGHLSTAPPGAPLGAVSLGTPHYSLDQLRRLDGAIAGWRPAPGVAVYVSAGRDTWVAAAQEGLPERLAAAGVRAVADTCVYVTSILDPGARVVMTDSGKLAHYAPANLGVEVAFGTLADCLASAAEGRVVRTGR